MVFLGARVLLYPVGLDMFVKAYQIVRKCFISLSFYLIDSFGEYLATVLSW